MAQIIVHTFLSPANALAACIVEAGEIHVCPTETDIASLTPEQRAELVHHTSTDGRITFPRTTLRVRLPGWAGVVEGLDAEIREAAEKRAETDAQIERERESYRRILAGQTGAWDSAPNYSRDDAVAKALWEQVKEKREADRVARVLAADAALGNDLGAHIGADDKPDAETTAVLSRATQYGQAEITTPHALAIQAECERRRVAADAERQRALEPFRTALRQYVIDHVTNYARAATEGHDVTGVACDAILAEIESQLSEIGALAPHYGGGDPPPDRACPAQLAYDVLDRVRALDLFPKVFGEASSRIVRVDVSRKDLEYRTAVEVTWTWPDGDTSEWYVLADPAGLPEDES